MDDSGLKDQKERGEGGQQRTSYSTSNIADASHNVLFSIPKIDVDRHIRQTRERWIGEETRFSSPDAINSGGRDWAPHQVAPDFQLGLRR